MLGDNRPLQYSQQHLLVVVFYVAAVCGFEFTGRGVAVANFHTITHSKAKANNRLSSLCPLLPPQVLREGLTGTIPRKL